MLLPGLHVRPVTHLNGPARVAFQFIDISQTNL